MKKSTKNILFLTAATIAGMYIFNKYVDSKASEKNLLKTDGGEFFKWKEGAIFYHKLGSGKPILLIHDTDSRSCAEEWAKIAKKLSKTHTVYAIDLLGCGRSDKPAIKYTNYLYVQMITAFAKEVIKEKTDVVATNMSTAPVIMANNLDKDLFDKIILINPSSLQSMEEVPDNLSRFKQSTINLPIIGTFIYNLLMSAKNIGADAKKKFFHHADIIPEEVEDTYYESAHLGGSKGKYLYSSILSKHINMNMLYALKSMDKPVNIIGSTDMPNNIANLDAYHNTNKNFEITHISNSSLYPQIETPEKVLTIIKKITE